MADSGAVFPTRSEREIQPHLSAQDAVGAEEGGSVVCGGGGGISRSRKNDGHFQTPGSRLDSAPRT